MNFDPSVSIIDEEVNHLFMCYCSFVNNLKGKKLSIQNVFVATLEDEKLKNLLKMILTLETDQELVRVFLDADPAISRSKMVTKFLNNRNKKKK